MKHYSLKKTSRTQITVELEAQLYLAPQDTYIGQLRFSQGFRVEGVLELLGAKASIQVEVITNQGITADVEISPIVIYSPAFLSITGESLDKGPLLSLATFNQPTNPRVEFRQPHLFIFGKMQLLGLQAEIFVRLTVQGFSFHFELNLENIVIFDLNGEFDDLDHFSCSGTVTS